MPAREDGYAAAFSFLSGVRPEDGGGKISLRIGIPFDHLSEDGWHGEQHLSIFEWYPAMPSAPVAGKEEAFFALADAYVADPTDERFWAFYDAIDTMTECAYDLSNGQDPEFYQRACDWMRLKMKSLQVQQHMLRRSTTSYPDVLADQPAGTTPVEALDLVIHRSPIWEAGDFIRVAPLQRPQQTACFSQPNLPCTLLPAKIDATVHEVPTYEEARIKQGEVFQQSWFVMSWLRDPALLYQSHNFATFIGDYLESVLLPHYDIHHAFVFARMAASRSASAAWMNAGGFREGTGKIASVRTFSFKQVWNNFSPPPQDDPRRAAHERMNTTHLTAGPESAFRSSPQAAARRSSTPRAVAAGARDLIEVAPACSSGGCSSRRSPMSSSSPR